MGILIDTNVFVRVERAGEAIDFNRWRSYGDAFISAVTVSELLVGVHRANTPERRRRRRSFVEAIIATVPALDFSASVARTHARMLAQLPPGLSVPAHAALIAATAVHYDHAVLTGNRRDFSPFAGLDVVDV